MNKFTKAGIVCAALTLVGQGAYAQINPDDLILGFNKTGQSDYVVDLGAFSSLSTTAQTDLTVSSGFSLSTFNSTYASLSGVNAVVTGGNNGNGGPGDDVFLSALRVGAVSGTAGTEHALSAITTGNPVTEAAGKTATITAGVQSSTSVAGITLQVGTSPTVNGKNTVMSLLNAQPYGGLTSFASGDITLDVFQDTRQSGNPSATGFEYVGAVTIDVNGGSADILYTPAGIVPEPSTYGLFGAAGLLLLSMRRQFRRVIA